MYDSGVSWMLNQLAREQPIQPLTPHFRLLSEPPLSLAPALQTDHDHLSKVEELSSSTSADRPAVPIKKKRKLGQESDGPNTNHVKHKNLNAFADNFIFQYFIGATCSQLICKKGECFFL